MGQFDRTFGRSTDAGGVTGLTVLNYSYGPALLRLTHPDRLPDVYSFLEITFSPFQAAGQRFPEYAYLK